MHPSNLISRPINLNIAQNYARKLRIPCYPVAALYYKNPLFQTFLIKLYQCWTLWMDAINYKSKVVRCF